MIQLRQSNPFWGDSYEATSKNLLKENLKNMTDEKDKMIETIREVLAVLEKEYPDVFREDGFTLQSTQLMGMLQHILQGGPQTMMPPQ